MVDKKAVTGVTDGLTTIVKLLAEFTESVGGGVGVLNLLGTTMMRVFSNQIASSLTSVFYNIQGTIDNIQNVSFAKMINNQFAEAQQDPQMQE